MTRRRVDAVDARSTPSARVMHNVPEQDTVEGLPLWVRGLSYRADDDTIALRLFDTNEPLLMTPEEAIALTGAVLRLVDASARNREIIDIDSDDGPDDRAPGWAAGMKTDPRGTPR